MTDNLQLCFNKDDVLYVDNTMFNGIPGHWRAWKLDSEGLRQQCGIIPSKYKYVISSSISILNVKIIDFKIELRKNYWLGEVVVT